MMSCGEMCNDGRFEKIAECKKRLVEATNIETSADEMAVIDDILFRFWQMRWLDKILEDAVPVVRCKDCLFYEPGDEYGYCGMTAISMPPNGFCSDGERKDDATD